jgi:hypothetical protein
VKAVDEPGVEELVQVEEDIGVLMLRVQLQFESREDVAHHHPKDVVEQPRGQVEGVRLTASSLSLGKKTRNLLLSSSNNKKEELSNDHHPYHHIRLYTYPRPSRTSVWPRQTVKDRIMIFLAMII